MRRIIRVAPVALLNRPEENYCGTLADLGMEAAQIAPITHGHSLGYMSGTVVCHIISRILTSASKIFAETNFILLNG